MTGTDWIMQPRGGAYRIRPNGMTEIKPLPTKHGMVQKILKALYNTSRSFSTDHHHYKKLIRQTKGQLLDSYIKAEKVIGERILRQNEGQR